MNQKMMQIASIIFALVFIVIFMVAYKNGNSLLGNTMNSYFQAQSVTSMLDLDYINNKTVTADTVESIQRYINTNKVFDPSLNDILIDKGSTSTKYKVTITKANNKISKIKFIGV